MLKLNLQYFSEDIEDVIDDPSNGEEDLISAIKSLKESEENPTDDDDEVVDEDEVEDDVEETEDEVDDVEDEEDDEVVEEEPKKKVQSKEDNAKFAAQRRQKEFEAKIKAELENSEEYKLAKRLSDLYGRPVDQIMKELEEAELQKEAEATKVPIERLRKEREIEETNKRLEMEINQLKFQNWQTTIKADSESLKKDYPMLTQEDMDEAVNYILHTARNVEMPLEQAVYALHGKKIIENQVKAKAQDDLAKQSGRAKKTPISPKGGGKAKVSANLTAEEQYIAKQFGMTFDEYAKNKG